MIKASHKLSLEKKISEEYFYVIVESVFPSTKMDTFMIYTAASQQGAMNLSWLHFWEVVIPFHLSIANGQYLPNWCKEGSEMNIWQDHCRTSEKCCTWGVKGRVLRHENDIWSISRITLKMHSLATDYTYSSTWMQRWGARKGCWS